MLIHPDRPELRLFGRADLDSDGDGHLDPARAVYAWARAFLAAPHAELGRDGNVCPFVGASLDADTFWLAIHESRPDAAESLAAIAVPYFDWLPDLDPRFGPGADARAALVLFPALSEAKGVLIEDAGALLRPGYAERGYLVGRYRPGSTHGSVRNEAFRPLRAPVAMLGVRPMVPEDVPFVLGDDAIFAAWHRRFGSRVPDRYSRLVAERALSLEPAS